MQKFNRLVNRVLKHSTKAFGGSFKYFRHDDRGGGVFSVPGIFDMKFEFLDPETEMRIVANDPSFGINLNDFSFDPEPDDQLIAEGIRYRVVEKHADGRGGAMLKLKKLRTKDRVEDVRE